jgi:hypothetical protein
MNKKPPKPINLAALPFNDYRRQVTWLLIQAKECKPGKIGTRTALKLRHRADILQTLITRYEN